MAAQFEILTGIAGSGKTARMLGEYRRALGEARANVLPGTTLWLTPTNRARNLILEQLCDGELPVLFAPNVLTFRDFAERLLRSAPQVVTPLAPAMQRLLLRRIVDRLRDKGTITHFREIAGTAGFLDLVATLIAELKRGETWPEDFEAACAARGARPADRELAQIYRDYQQTLLDSGVYDSEGRFWSAWQALKRGEWGPFAELSLVVADGFTDFTHTQYEILALLRQRTERMLISLPLEAPLVRAELFAKPRAVIESLRKAGPVSVIELEAPSTEPPQNQPETKVDGRPAAKVKGRGSRQQLSLSLDARIDDSTSTPVTAGSIPAPHLPAIPRETSAGHVGDNHREHIARHLFANPRTTKKAESVEGIEVVAAAGERGEVRWLAARIKGMLLAGTRPDEIVIALRELPGYRDLIDEEFTAAGIPFALCVGRPLDRVPLCRALVQLLQLEAEDWPFDRLLAVLNSSEFRPDWYELREGRAARDAAAVLRRFKLNEGRERILERLEKASADDGEAAKDADEPRVDKWAVQRASRLLQRLSRTTKELRKSHDLKGWAVAIRAVIDELRLDGPRQSANDAAEAQPSGAGAFLERILFDAAKADALSGGEPARRKLSEFLVELTDLLQQSEIPPGVPEAGRVRILPVEQVRNLDVPYLFIAGLTERSFPRAHGDDCLYSELDRRELNVHGLSLAHRQLRAQEEMLMFYGIVTRATRRLVLSYPVVTADGEPLSPSPYLVALQDLFADGVLKPQLEERLDPVPTRELLLSPSDARIFGMSEALHDRPGLLRAIANQSGAAATIGNLLAAVDMNALRFHTPGFSRYEGALVNSGNREWLRQRYSPEREFSATQLESYANCPFRFFLEHVLGVEPLESTEIETEYGRRGSLVHDVLATLHRELLGPEGGEATPPDGSRIVNVFHRLLAERLGERPHHSALQKALQEIEGRLLSEWGAAYGDQWTAYLNGGPTDGGGSPLPALFETAFGRSGTGTGEAATFDALVIGHGDQAVRIGGRIDRIDLAAGKEGRLFTIVDYKTGKPRTDKFEDIQSGRAIQLALYTLAVVRLGIAGPNAGPLQMGYWHLRGEGFAPNLRQKKKPDGRLPPLDAAVWSALVGTLDESIPQIVSSLRSGKFPVFNVDDACAGRCPFGTVCRVAQVRALPESLGKTWEAGCE